ncbi:AraC family transcriptional regulator [Roseimicrobium gellanilyticum]|uniref:AraC family transcriptional regulator n=2 Tax=Roseimicrobium gellanilyticum TaxID=748857 RepID=A0A366HWY3_9BACT|nr:AraC family transcriptional regulator [Roseimicrobium gellanilyticum]
MVALFDGMMDTVFFVKDAGGRYLEVNQTLVERCGLRSKSELLGRTVSEVFPGELARSYARQDLEVLRQGRKIRNRLELHWQKNRRAGWCLTAKVPIRRVEGEIIGLVGISRDLQTPGGSEGIPPTLSKAMAYLEKHCDDSALSPALLARKAEMSPTRFARLVKRVFHLTPGQIITQARIQMASRLLQETEGSVAEIALACGYCDHSAFTRAFREATGVTPSQFRVAVR